MKTKEYINQFISKCEDLEVLKEDSLNKQVLWLCNTFMNDYEKIKKDRNIDKGSKTSSLINLINDYNKKWFNIAYGINNYFLGKFNVSVIRASGFLDLLKEVDPQYIPIVSNL